MNTWSPLWSKLVDSSLWTEAYHVRILFTTMMALKDADHVVRASAFQLHRRANITQEEVADALRVLSEPDLKRQDTQDFQGRRIEKVDDGWLILNGEKYRQMMRKESRREYQRVKQKEYRARDRSQALPQEDQEPHPDGARNGEHVEPSGNRLHRIPATVDELIAIGASLMPAPVSERRCRRIWAHFEGTRKLNQNGDVFWVTSGGTVVRDIRAKMTGMFLDEDSALPVGGDLTGTVEGPGAQPVNGF